MHWSVHWSVTGQ